MRSVVLFLIVALVPALALAHRVNIFAYVEGGDVVVECSYSKSKRVNHGRIDVRDAVSQDLLLQGETDENGLFRFPVPQAARQAGSGLRILLQAGEGHRNEWIVEASEFMSGSTTEAVSDSPAPAPTAQTAPASTSHAGLTRVELEEVLDARLAPIKRAVLEQSEAGPGLREIVGGIGWIFGLIGIAAYFKSRTRV